MADVWNLAEKVADEIDRVNADTRRRVANLEKLVSDIHSTGRRVTMTSEAYIGGLRFDPGDYMIMRIGPVSDDPKF
jgi:hypothetical protein